MNRWVCTMVACSMVAAFGVVLANGPAEVESPPTGISPSEFATEYTGCLGGLRSWIASGESALVDGFSKDFNPGKHQGSVGEEEFLRALFGFDDAELEAFCNSF